METRKKFRHLAAYIFWGLCTTGVNIALFQFCRIILTLAVMPSNIIAWIFSVLFAFYVNRRFVFTDGEKKPASLIKEMGLFYLSRLFSGALDMALVFVLISSYHFPELWMKIFINGIVIVVNYLASAYLVFRRRYSVHDKTT